MESIELSLGAIVALLILKEVFGFLRSRAPNGNNKNTDDCTKAIQHINELWDGRRSMELTLEKLRNSIELQTIVMKENLITLQETRRDINRVEIAVKDRDK